MDSFSGARNHYCKQAIFHFHILTYRFNTISTFSLLYFLTIFVSLKYLTSRSFTQLPNTPNFVFNVFRIVFKLIVPLTRYFLVYIFFFIIFVSESSHLTHWNRATGDLYSIFISGTLPSNNWLKLWRTCNIHIDWQSSKRNCYVWLLERCY